MPRWATKKEAAEYMRLSPNTIYNAISLKTPLGKLFEGRVVDLDKIDEFLKAKK